MISQNFNDWLNYMQAIQESGVAMHPAESEVVTPVEPEPDPENPEEPKTPGESTDEKETEETEKEPETQAAKKVSKKVTVK